MEANRGGKEPRSAGEQGQERGRYVHASAGNRPIVGSVGSDLMEQAQLAEGRKDVMVALHDPERAVVFRAVDPAHD